MQGAHALLATATKQEIFVLDSNEAEQMANAMCDILEEYGMVVNKRTLLWGNLFGIVSLVYGPRIMILQKQAMDIRKARPDPTKPQHRPPAAPAPASPQERAGVPTGTATNGSEMIFTTGVAIDLSQNPQG